MKWLTRAVFPLLFLLFSGCYGLYAQEHRDELRPYPQQPVTTPVPPCTCCIQQPDIRISIGRVFAERGRDKLETADNEDEEEEVTAVKKNLYTDNFFTAYFARAPGAYIAPEAAPTSRNPFFYSSLQRYILLRVIRI